MKFIKSLIILIFTSCSSNNITSDRLEIYGCHFNSIRDSIGLLPYNVKWKSLPFENRNAYWVYDQDILDCLNDTTDRYLEKGMFYGKCLFFNDEDSLDATLISEADIFVIKKKNEFGQHYKNRLSYIFDFQNNNEYGYSIGWKYLIDYDLNIEKGNTLIFKSKYITKSEADSILISWGIIR